MSTTGTFADGVHASRHAAGGADPVTPGAIAAVASSAVGQAGGVASLDASGNVLNAARKVQANVDLSNVTPATGRAALGLGTAATTDITAYATAAQGAQIQEVNVGIDDQNAVLIPGATYKEITGGTSQSLVTGVGYLGGYSLRETTGTTAAVVRLRDGVDVGGQLLATISLAPAESARDWFMPQGIGFANGLYVEIVSGTVEGVCWLGAAR